MEIDRHGRLIPDFGYRPEQTFHVGGVFSHYRTPAIDEQMGTDPISKLAAAIHDLADATRELAKTQALAEL